eukprot:TRINITY_DN2741_c0_g1_i4.p1 TRINITY_DN2741_c0_g1~~TRINITY_DN2741_c0_g1_i4.p1  ORF type:complete len:148 (-),score=28.19 TRINITY_DN2741_c0_g1_i4:13-456(-)
MRIRLKSQKMLHHRLSNEGTIRLFELKSCSRSVEASIILKMKAQQQWTGIKHHVEGDNTYYNLLKHGEKTIKLGDMVKIKEKGKRGYDVGRIDSLYEIETPDEVNDFHVSYTVFSEGKEGEKWTETGKKKDKLLDDVLEVLSEADSK